jgi:ribonuclease HI
MQWNCNGARSSKPALEQMVQQWRPDVILLQETKLQHDAHFDVKGYACIRADRTRGRRADGPVVGGGVATLIRDGLRFHARGERVTAPADRTTDALCVDIYCDGKQKPITLVNLYIPPVRRGADDDREQNFDPAALPASQDTFVCGDLNAHSLSWDANAAEDALGHKIDDWAADHGFLAANSGEATRRPDLSVPGTAPDVTLYHNRWLGRVAWRIEDEYGYSDHSPITAHVSFEATAPSDAGVTVPAWNMRKADWDRYRTLLGERLADLPEWDPETFSVDEANRQFCDAIVWAGRRAIPRGKRKNPVYWWCPEAEEARIARNAARQAAIAYASDANLDAARLAQAAYRDVVREKKAEAWKEFTASLNMRTSPTEVWRVIHALDGKCSSSGCAAIKVGDKVVTKEQDKAEAFVKEYAAVSHLKPRRTAADIKLKRDINAWLREPCTDHPADEHTGMCAGFDEDEMKDALAQSRKKKAPGPDEIATEMLHELSGEGKRRLLQLVNMSWLRAVVPSSWRKAEIVPIPKKGKPLDQVGSHRPISLTSAVAKLVERMVKNRMYHALEKNRAIDPCQTGFRTARCSEDQVLRITQQVDNAFQHRTDKRTVLVLIDFKRAYDKVWKYGLLHKLRACGFPRCVVRWCKQFLWDRQARVRIGSRRSRYRVFREGLPQGSVLSPFFFLVYINDLTHLLPDDVSVSLFADDVAVWASASTTAEASAKVQRALDRIETWADEWRMEISAEKCESTLFSLDPRDAHVQPEVKLMGVQVPFSSAPTFLGVRFDRQLSFRDHVESVEQRMKKRMQPLRALSGRSFGAAASELRTMYLAYIRSVLDYCGGAYLPACADTTLKKLQVVQNQAARCITRCTKTTPADVLSREANLIPVKTRGEQLAAIALARAMTRSHDDPLRRVTQNRPAQRLRRMRSWLAPAEAVRDRAGLRDAQLAAALHAPSHPPWKPVTARAIFNVTLTLRTGRDDLPATRLAQTTQLLEALGPADVEVWTDGSVVDGTGCGGGGVAICRTGLNDIELAVPAGRICSSYRSELVAIDKALEALCARVDTAGLYVRLCTDSLAAVRRLSAGPRQQTDVLCDAIWTKISTLCETTEKLEFVWVPGHSGIAGNDQADDLADIGTRRPQAGIQIAFPIAKAAIIRTTRKKWLTEDCVRAHRHFTATKGRIPVLADQMGLSVYEGKLVSQLRSGHCPLLRAYLHWIRAEASPACLQCEQAGRQVDDTAEHFLLACPELLAARISAFGRPDPCWREANRNAVDVVKFIRLSGRLAPRH